MNSDKYTLDEYLRSHIWGDDRGCWIWLKKLFPDNYGLVYWEGKCMRAHRLSYTHFVGSIPKGQLVCHHCDVPSCINPNHLFLGTNKDNQHDMIKKKRDRKAIGINSGGSKLTDIQVLAIRADKRSIKEIAFQYGVYRQAITRIKSRQTWKHL